MRITTGTYHQHRARRRRSGSWAAALLEEVALARYRTAEAPYADVVRAQVELGRVEDELRSLAEAADAAAARLNAALGRSVGAPLPPPAGLPELRLQLSTDDVENAVRQAAPSSPP